MSNTTIKKILHLHKHLASYQKKKAKSFVGKDFERLSNYSLAFKKSLPKTTTLTNLNILIKKIHKSNVVLYGDFHTLKKSQDHFIKLVHHYMRCFKQRKIIIALEAFNDSKQKYIDDYLKNNISDDDFLKKTAYKKNWGFPWENYKKIIDFAKAEKATVLALNSSEKNLETRDKKIARTILSQVKINPEHLIICVIGEHHLADKHLPFFLEAPKTNNTYSVNTLRVVSNIDRYFFQTKEKHIKQDINYLKLKQNFFCIINTPPWIKWLSYVIWEENDEKKPTLINNKNNDIIRIDSDHFEIEYHFLKFLKYLSKFFDVELKKESKNITFKKRLTSQDKRIQHNLNTSGFYINESQSLVLIKSLCLQTLINSSGQWLFLKATSRHVLENKQIIAKELLKKIIGNISVKLFNPCFNLQSTQLPKEALNLIQTIKQHPTSTLFYKKLMDDHKQHNTTMLDISKIISVDVYSLIISNNPKDIQALCAIFFDKMACTTYEKRLQTLLALCR